ncbi:MAG: hypothetical protein GFH27_549279n242 [Chloroflexi bacterium AL-W]|nr:hypothetical protein [Chloroflexi bacterium AL-N1]NOK65208.1 hypothetical protein [Chloroflexi bacterium AL-N10]NOK72527.1 hypothetical protein [Chloroflexi bacterium AL-N5]NOK79387.1 hypothetical protein [Chloroflexi bacterium AL-W]NOK87303.1 hypothetical protein [Chloroflexi bacterium AL-N15]
MYNFLVFIHSYVRWAIFILAIWALYSAYMGLIRKRDWTEADRRPGSLFTLVMSVQLLIGFLVYFYPGGLVLSAFSNISNAMATTQLRFFVAEHLVVMIIAIAFAHIGTARAKRAVSAIAKYRQSAIWYTLSTITMLLGIPWWRAMFRGL